MLSRVLPLALVFGLVGCGSEPPAPAATTTTTTMPAPPPAPFELGATVRLTGFDPETGQVEVKQINVWNAAVRTSVVCRSAHGATARITEREYSTSEERWYFAIEAGACKGWLPQSFLEAAP